MVIRRIQLCKMNIIVLFTLGVINIKLTNTSVQRNYRLTRNKDTYYLKVDILTANVSYTVRVQTLQHVSFLWLRIQTKIVLESRVWIFRAHSTSDSTTSPRFVICSPRCVSSAYHRLPSTASLTFPNNWRRASTTSCSER